MKRALGILFLACCARGAHAEGVVQAGPPAAAASSEENAREAFRAGYAHTERQEWAEALGAFERSSALRPHPLTTYSIAQCEFELGHFARARKVFRRALEERDVGGVALGAEERSHAHEYLAEVESKLVRVSLVVGPGFTRLTVDGRGLERETVGGQAVYVVGTAAAGEAAQVAPGTYELLADPGEHVFAASSAGGADQVSRLVLERDHPSIVELQMPLPLSAPPAEITKAKEAPPPASGTPPLRVVAYTALGVGAAGVATGAVFGILAITKKSELDGSGDCKPDGGAVKCAPSRSSDVDALHLYADVATVGFVLGGVGLAAGAALLLWGPPPPSARDHVRVQPWLGFGAAGVRGVF